VDANETSESEPVQIPSGDAQLTGVLTIPNSIPARGAPGVIVCHGYPSPVVGAEKVGFQFPELAARLTHELEWSSLFVTWQGCGESSGQFSVQAWLNDLAVSIEFLANRPEVTEIYVVGFGTGGAVAVCAAAVDPRVSGVAAMSAPADFTDWAADPKQLLKHSRRIGVIDDPNYPPDFDAWAQEISSVSAVRSAAEMQDRALLVVHGADDELVPDFDARDLANSHQNAELRLIEGAGHVLRSDPRAIAVLLGWLERQG